MEQPKIELNNWSALEKTAGEVGVQINSDDPQGSRLAVALACDGNNNIPAAIEAVTGTPIAEFGSMRLALLIQEREKLKDSEVTPFYEGFLKEMYF